MSERHYRRLLWAYPRAYRDRHGAEMVTTMMDLADGQRRALNAAMTGMPAPAAVYREPSAMKGPGALVRADGTSDYSAERVRAALLADGWRITSFREDDGAILVDLDQNLNGVRIPAKGVFYTAAKGGLKLHGDGTVVVGGADRGLAGGAMYGTEVWPREPVVVRPLTVAGSVAGLLAGWLLAAAAAYRLRDSGRSRRWLATALSAGGFAVLAVPVYELYRDAYQVLVYAHGSPYPYIVDSPDDGRVTLFCTLVGLLAIVTAIGAARPAVEGRELRA